MRMVVERDTDKTVPFHYYEKFAIIRRPKNFKGRLKLVDYEEWQELENFSGDWRENPEDNEVTKEQALRFLLNDYEPVDCRDILVAYDKDSWVEILYYEYDY